MHYLPLFSTNPQLVEGTQTREDTASKPSAITTFGRITGGVNLNLDI